MNNTNDTIDIKPNLKSLIKFEDENHKDISTAYDTKEQTPIAVQITVIKEEYIEENCYEITNENQDYIANKRNELANKNEFNSNLDDIANENYEFDNANDLITFEIEADVGTEVFVKEEYVIHEAEANKYVCKFCSRVFEDWKILLKHNLNHLKLKLEKCDQPPKKKTSSKQTYQPDSTTHWQCIVCKNNYDKYKTWYQHLREVHTAYNFVCKFCQKLYHTSKGINKHLKVHNNEKEKYLTTKESPCTICKAVLDNKHALKTHMRTVHSSKSFECDLCGLKYKCFSYLQTHKRRVHKETGEFICDICFAKFKSRRRLLIHIRRPHVRFNLQQSKPKGNRKRK